MTPWIPSTFPSGRRQTRRLGLVALAVLGVAAIGAGSSSAGDPFVAGGPSTRSVAVPTDELSRAKAHGAALAAALNLPATSFRAVRLDDRFEHRVYDEVTGLDARGREVAIARFDLDGSLSMAASLGWHDNRAPGVERAAVASRAAALARSAGVRVGGMPDVRSSAGGGGWSAAWPRSVDGIAVRGDGVRLLLWADGTFHGLVRTERPLAGDSGARIAAADATRAADAVVDRAVASRTGLVAARPELAWLAPNDAFGGPRADAPAPELRLAWVVRYDASGPVAERVRAIEIWIDATDGSLVGGDVVE